MCGRYYIDDEMAREIEKLLQKMDSAGRTGSGLAARLPEEIRQRQGDVYPAGLAPVITGNASGLHLEWQRWGLPGFTKGGVIFNARSETVLEKRMFQDGVLHRRVVIPARWLYEWNRAREKITFLRDDAPILYMAGFYNHYEDGPHFVILTTEANASMKSTHDRMPLILEREELADWLTDDIKTRQYLSQVPVLLSRQAEYEQESFRFE